MIEAVLTRHNLARAKRSVQRNGGSAGIDRQRTDTLDTWLSDNHECIRKSVQQGKYRAQPIPGVEIPKANGKTRMLGIPTVSDRLLQQAVLQVIQIRFEREFSEQSYGFRPRKNLHQAVSQAQHNIHEGYTHIVDIDLKSFFDEVDHCYLPELIYRKVKCRQTLWLIRKWLRAPIQVNGRLQKRRKGIPKGVHSVRCWVTSC